MKKAFKIRHSAPLISAIEMIIETKTLKKGLGRTLQAIAMHWNPKGNVFPSQERLAQLTDIDRRTVVTHIKKLKDLGVIRVIKRPNKMVNGQQVRQTMMYVIVESVLGALFEKAKQALPKKPKGNPQKDHLAPSQKDPTNNIPNGIQSKENTVKASASRVFLQKRLEALQSELAHLSGLAQKAAYDSAVKKKRIERGEIFSDEEIARRKAIAARNAEQHAKAAAINSRVRALETALLTWNRTRKGFTKAMFDELRRYSSLISPVSGIMLRKFEIEA